MNQHYIFGYGTLISKEAREKTGRTSEATPVYIKNLHRTWSAFDEGNYSPLGVKIRPGHEAGGVLFSVSLTELPAFDERERHYQRTEIPLKDIQFLHEEQSFSDATIEVYIPPLVYEPHKETPIIQSYIDVCIAACLEYSEDFARHFIKHTFLWDSPWVDDRKDALYQRALNRPTAALFKTVDALLKEELSLDLKNRIPIDDYTIDLRSNREPF